MSPILGGVSPHFKKLLYFIWWELPNTKKIEEYLRNSGNNVKLKNLFKK